MIRTGPRGSGQWRNATWEEALDHVADKLRAIIREFGGHSIVLGEQRQPATHVSKTFMKAIGSPNHFSHDALCKASINSAARSLFGYTDAQIGIDYKNVRHLVLYGCNLFETIEVKAVNAFCRAMENGARLTYIDPRVTVTATKANRYWMIRPGTDLALNYALIHIILREGLYDQAYVSRWVLGLDRLHDFVQPHTPKWAEAETGIPARAIVDLAREISRDKPSVVFHCGYRGASHPNEIHMRRSIFILNALMGSVEARGGLFFKKGPEEVNGKPACKLTEQPLPEVSVPRFDKVGTPNFPLPDPNHGVGQMLPKAILTDDPYPIKALFCYCFDPLMSIPDTNTTRKALDKLDLIVAIDGSYSDIAWYSDVVLPESIYLERMDCIWRANGLKPQVFLCQQAVTPCYDTRPGPIILKQLGERLGIGKFFPYETMADLVRWQLEGTGFGLEDFSEKGFVAYADREIFWDRHDGIPFKTPSGKIEVVSSLLENAGCESFPVYETVPSPAEDQFRLIVGGYALQTHVSARNNPYLNELAPENLLWINSKRSEKLGIRNGDLIEISSDCGSGEMKAFVTDLIQPEAVFMLHGYGHESQLASRSFRKGVNDAVLMENVSDMIGGSPAMHNTFVTVKRI